MSDWTKHFSDGERTGKVPIENRDFRGCDLTGARLDGATLMKCSFANAMLRDARLNGANLFGCDFTGVDASGCQATGTSFLDVSWRGGRAHGADLAKSEFTRVDLREMDFSVAVLRGASFDGSNLTAASFRHANLQHGARFADCDLRDTNVDDALLGGTTLERCAVHGMKGSPCEPYDVSVIDADLSVGRDASRLGGWNEVTGVWRAQRRPDPRRAPFELGPPIISENLASTLLVSILEQRPELDLVFDATPHVFRVQVPWFQQIGLFALSAWRAKPQRIVCAAQLSAEGAELLEGSPAGLTRAAGAEPVRIVDTQDALRYARFAYHVTRGAALGAAWIRTADDLAGSQEPSGFTASPERIEATGAGWTVHVWTVVDGKLVANRITVGRDGAFACEENVRG